MTRGRSRANLLDVALLLRHSKALQRYLLYYMPRHHTLDDETKRSLRETKATIDRILTLCKVSSTYSEDAITSSSSSAQWIPSTADRSSINTNSGQVWDRSVISEENFTTAESTPSSGPEVKDVVVFAGSTHPAKANPKAEVKNGRMQDLRRFPAPAPIITIADAGARSSAKPTSPTQKQQVFGPPYPTDGAGVSAAPNSSVTLQVSEHLTRDYDKAIKVPAAISPHSGACTSRSRFVESGEETKEEGSIEREETGPYESQTEDNHPAAPSKPVSGSEPTPDTLYDTGAALGNGRAMEEEGLGRKQSKILTDIHGSAQAFAPVGRIYRGTDNYSSLLAVVKEGAIHDRNKRLPAQKILTKKKRLLLAVFPSMGVSEKQGNQSVAERLFGENIAKLCYRYRHILSAWSWLATLSAWLFAGFSVYLPNAAILSLASFLLGDTVSLAGDSSGVVLSIVTAMSGFFFLSSLSQIFCFLWMMNYDLLLKVLRQYETRIFFFESALFAFSYTGILCFKPHAYMLSLGWLFAHTWCSLYDVFPVAIRARLRYGYALYLIYFSIYLVSLHARLSPRQCSYRVDFVYGLVDELAPVVNGEEPKKSPWGFSLLEFGLNRGFTLCVLQMKLLYSSFRHPQDCMLIKSRMRLIEAPLIVTDLSSTSTASLSSERSQSPSESGSSRVAPMPVSLTDQAPTPQSKPTYS